MVGFDSIIPPGREGKITAKINLEGYHGGPFKKSSTVTSNASNTPSLTLYVGGTVKAVIDVTPSSLRLKAGANKEANDPVVLRTDKADLKISDVSMKARQENGTQWQTALPLYLDYSLTRKEKPDSAGIYEYTLRVGINAKDASLSGGQVEVTTNHPDKKTITISAYVMPK